MVLAYWGAELHQPELGCLRAGSGGGRERPRRGGTNRWPFNTAYAGEFPGMRAYVTRLDDIAELEQWLAAGVPVILSVSSYLTNDRHDGPDSGHLIVCVGVYGWGRWSRMIPAFPVKRGERVRRIYRGNG